MGKIIVIGSSNTDLITKVKKFPLAGETIIGESFLQVMGGKGANQAVAAHKLGGEVKFVTCLGQDANGQNSLSYFREMGLDASSAVTVNDAPSGTALILVDEKGENCIVITPGANHRLLPDHIQRLENEIAGCDLILLQMEIPYETVRMAALIASQHHTRVMLNVAPATKLDDELLKLTDILVVNETEAETISGEKISAIGEEAMVGRLLELGVKTVVLTLGEKGCIMKDRKESHTVPAFRVKAVDTTAAGDTFCGALAVAMNRGDAWEQALQFASAASAICVTRMGAQPSIPAIAEVESFLEKNQHQVIINTPE